MGCFWALAIPAFAGDPEYPREIARWREVSVPSGSDKGDRMAWFYAANNSHHKWRVFSKDGQICAQLTTAKPAEQRERPQFAPKAGGFLDASSFARVDDGWLVGFNEGEFGGAIYWFSTDGKRNYRVSDHLVVDFFSLPDGLYAIQGLAHMSQSVGSIVHLARPHPNARWQATMVAKLPFAPYAVSVRRDGTMLITLSDSLVRVGSDRKITTLLSDPPWSGLLPNSSVLSSDEEKLYIGMHQFVGEFDIRTKKLRLLIPSTQFLNKLSKEGEQEIRKQYGD